VLPLVTLALVTLVGMAAFAVDVGYWRYQQRLEQAAADSAAIAGGIELTYSSSLANVTAAARKDATSNGYTDDSGVTTNVTVNNPPSSGPYSGNAGAVEVIVQVKQPLFFAGVFGGSFQWISARAVSRLTGGGADCIIALNPSFTPYTLQVTGGSLSAPTCNITDDGSMNFTGGTITAQGIGVVGSVTHSGGTYAQATPAPTVPAADPCESIPACATLTNTPPVTSPCTTESVSNGSPTISQGIYCGIQISGGSLTLNPGLYIVTGNKPLKQTGGTFTGHGVTFYIDQGSNINLTGGTSSLGAPTSGTYNGLLFFQPAANTNSAQLTGGGGSSCPSSSPVFTGLFYAPGAFLNVTGGSSWDPSSVVVGSLQVTGGALTCITTPVGGAPIQRAVLGE
jgi:Putative Flp pilus-assembly TadE/G-like